MGEGADATNIDALATPNNEVASSYSAIVNDSVIALATALTIRDMTVFSLRVNPEYHSQTDSRSPFYDPLRRHSSESEFIHRFWKELSPNPENFANYEPGCALAMSMGKIAAIDIDFSDEAETIAEVERIKSAGVVVLAWERTPRGGAHIWTLGHARAKGSVETPLGKVDYQGEGALLYIVGSGRPKYRNVDAYSFIQEPDWVTFDAATDEQFIRNSERVDSYLASIGMGLAKPTLVAGNIVVPDDIPAMPEWLTGEISDLSESVLADRSARFHHLVGACGRAGLDEGQTVAALTPWCEATGKYVGKVDIEVHRCWDKIVPNEPAEVAELCDFTLVGADDSSLIPVAGKMVTDEFWESRDYLSYIRQFAYAKTEAPYALVLAGLVRVSGELSPQIVLPAIVGSEVSLNYYGVLLDSSGGGKSSVLSMSRALTAWGTVECGITSGEGLITSYVQRSKDEDGVWFTEMKTDRLVVVVDEAEGLLAIESRHGNTVMPNLRTLWTSGGGISLNNKSEMEKHRIDPHTIRTALLIGGQPTALGKVFIDDGKGTAERFVTMRLQDASIPQQQSPIPKGSLPLRISNISVSSHGLTTFTYDPRIREYLINTHWAEKTGNSKTTSVISPSKYGKVTGHKNLIIAKTAALFAAWDGRLRVSYEDWGLAVHFLAVAGDSRKWGMERLNDSLASENRAAGIASAHREIATEETKDAVRVGSTADAIVEKVRRAGGRIKRKSVKSQLSAKQREYESEGTEAALATARLVSVLAPDQSTRGGERPEVEWLELGANA